MKVLYIPLDERPCNVKYPNMIAKIKDDLELITPPENMLPEKKKSANIEMLWEWIEKEALSCDAIILSIEMVVYGGLLPSRLHNESIEKCMELLNKIKVLKEKNPAVKLYASNLIMRTPHYDSSEEEPDYYAEYGEKIFEYGWLKDQKNREGLSTEDENKLNVLCDEIPVEVIADYEGRRFINIQINKEVIQLVKEGIIDFLSIPQDDSAPYGYTAIDQQKVMGSITKNRLQSKIHTYPGADEVGCTLFSRVYTDSTSKTPKVFVFYSSTFGSQLIPKYEDRPFGESIVSHIMAAGGRIVETSNEADIILAVNTPGKEMQESCEQDNKDITYTTYRNLRVFIQKISYYLKEGKKCIVADVAFSNGSDTELITMMDDAKILDQLHGYAGWNTNCNTVGTVLSTGIIGNDSINEQQRIYNLAYHILEDWGYQASVRKNTIENILPIYEASYYNFNGSEEHISESIRQQLEDLWSKEINNTFKEWQVNINKVFTPWHRMFEIGMEIQVQKERE